MGAVTVALLAKPRHYKAIYLGGITLYLAMTVAFALASGPGRGSSAGCSGLWRSRRTKSVGRRRTTG
jgi:hypothetical protein